MCGLAAELGCAMQNMSEQDRHESELTLVYACDVDVVFAADVTVLRAHDVQLSADKDAMLAQLSQRCVCVRHFCAL